MTATISCACSVTRAMETIAVMRKEDDDVDEEYSGPDIGQTSLRRGTRVRKQVKHLVPTHKGQSYD